MPADDRPTLLVRVAPWAIAVIAALAIVSCVVPVWLEAKTAADYSAQAALNKEICDLLAAVPPGQLYPAALSELPLTFPDGGDALLLKRFEYHSTGKTCTLRTEFAWHEPRVSVRSFPNDSQ
jgi:hypothetical protein